MEEGREVEMKLLHSEKNHIVRYSWRPLDREEQATIITMEIKDLGVSRRKTGEGIVLEITHDGWKNEEEKDRLEKVWKSALPVLKAILEGKKAKPWWENEKVRTDMRRVKLANLKQVVDEFELPAPKPSRKKTAAPGPSVWKFLQLLDGHGEWYLKDDGSEIELRYGTGRIFSLEKGGILVFSWRDLEKLLGRHLKDYTNRLGMEQEIEVHTGKTQEKYSFADMDPALFAQWSIDAIQLARDSS